MSVSQENFDKFLKHSQHSFVSFTVIIFSALLNIFVPIEFLELLGTILFLLLPIVALYLVFCVYKLSTAANMNIFFRVLLTLISVVPLMAIIVASSITNKNKEILEANGYKVGFFGPKKIKSA